jgi:hypothetical protein
MVCLVKGVGDPVPPDDNPGVQPLHTNSPFTQSSIDQCVIKDTTVIPFHIDPLRSCPDPGIPLYATIVNILKLTTRDMRPVPDHHNTMALIPFKTVILTTENISDPITTDPEISCRFICLIIES